MIRCCIISIMAHLGIIGALVVLSFIAPASRQSKPINISLISGLPGAGGGGGGGKGGGGAMQAAVAPPAPKPQEAKPPVSSKKPIEQRVTKMTPPKPKPAAPKPVAPKPAAKPAIHKAAKIVKTLEAPKATPKKVIHTAKKLVEPDKPKPKPTPAPTPAEPQEEAAVVENSQQDVATETKPNEAKPDKPEPAAPPAIDPSLLGATNAKVPGNQIMNKDANMGIGLTNGTGTGPGGPGGPGGGGPLDANQTYLLNAMAKIQQYFKPPQTRPGVQCRVRFFIQKDGTITNIQVVAGQSTGLPSWDQFAIQALEQTEKLPPLYDSCKENYLDVFVTFSYDRK